MSSLGGPNIITDGLVLYLDAANKKSLAEEPTVNFISNNPTPTSTTGFVASGGVGTLTYDSTNNAVRWVRTSYETWGAYAYNNSLDNYLFDTSSLYTISFKWKYGELHNAGTSHIFELVQDNGLNFVINPLSLILNSTLQSDGWYYFSKSAVPLNPGISQTGFPPRPRLKTNNLPGLTTDIYWKNLQFEKKPYVTPFVSGSRVPPWSDVSRRGNTGTLINGPTYDSSNGGSLVFDGIDDIAYFYGKTLPVAAFTTSYTFKLTDLLTTGYTYLQGNGNYQQYGYYCEISNASNSFAITLSNSSAVTGVSFVFNRTDVINNVVNIVWTYDGTTINGYQNGVLRRTVTATLIPDITPISYTPRFGSKLIGNVYTILNYNRALTGQEVLQNYNATKTRFNL